MANHVFNRWGILGAMAIAPVVVAAPAVAHTSRIEALWSEYKVIADRWNHTAMSEDESAALERRVSGLAKEIQVCADRSPRAIEIRLWLIVARDCMFKADSKAAYREDLDHLLASAARGDMEDDSEALLHLIRTIRA